MTPQSSLRLGFAGTPEFAVPALDALVRGAHTVQAVFTKADRPSGRGRTVHLSPVKKRALELGIEVHQPASFKTSEAAETLRALRLDALVVVAYGLILSKDALAAPRLGCFNIHASLLPRWRGAAPIQRALLAGDRTTGVTVMRMEEGLDSGPLLGARTIAIAPQDTAGSLHDRLAVQGGELIGEMMDALAADRARQVPQPQSGVTYAAKSSKAEALIDWREAAVQVLRRIRAFNPVPVAETRLNALQVRIWEAELVPSDAPETQVLPGTEVLPGTVVRATSGGIDVACGEGQLRVIRLQLAGRKPLAAHEFIQAQPLKGARFANS